MYKNILFDMDGTLIDSSHGVLASVAYALEQMGEPLPNHETLLRFLGPPLVDSFSAYCGMTQERATEAVAHYRVYYEAGGIDDFTLYPGVIEMLTSLSNSGLRLAVATSKPEVFAAHVIEKAGMKPYLSALCGALLPRGRDEKKEVIAALLQKEGFLLQESLMVGDRCFDVEGAAACGLGALGVLYGFGSGEELDKAGALALCPTPQAVADWILKNNRTEPSAKMLR